MADARLEHANITVSNPLKTAEMLCDLFGWHIRWLGEKGESIHGGHSLHVGADDTYLAIYAKGPEPVKPGTDSYSTLGGLNHLGIVVDDLDGIEKKVLAAGFVTFSHADYEPGRRFYFHDNDKIEYEVVQYD